MAQAVQDKGAVVFAGSFAGFCSTIITNPFDTLRVRLAASRQATGEAHKSLFGHLKKMFSNGILGGFKQALSINLICSVPSNAIYLSTYRLMSTRLKKEYGESSPIAAVLSSLSAVSATNCTLAPLFTARTRIQIDPTLTVRGVLMDIAKKEGVKGFYRGAGINIAGRAFEETIFWVLYEFAKYQTSTGTLTGGSVGTGLFAIIGLSAWCKAAGTFIAYPYNVVMTHLREVNKVTNKHEHTKILPTIQFIYRNDGIAGFYKGVAPQLCRSIPSKASQMVTFEAALLAYNYMMHRDARSERH